MGSLAEVLEFNAHQLTITVPNTEWWLGTLNAEQVKSTIYIYIYKKKSRLPGASQTKWISILVLSAVCMSSYI